LVFLAAAAYQFRTIETRFPQWFGGPERAAWPFVVEPDRAAPQFKISVLKPNAIEAGLHENDALLEINGTRVTGLGVAGDAISRANPGALLPVVARSNGTTVATRIRLISAEAQPIGFVALAGVLIMPAFCIVLGFWVVAVRPRDRLAWLLLAFLLGFTTFFDPFVESWGPVARDFGAIYHALFNATWGIWLLLFGIYFPESLPRGARGRTLWNWLTWLIVLPLGLRAALDVIAATGVVENYSSVFVIARFRGVLLPLFAACSYASSFCCIGCLAWKRYLAKRGDAERRLRLVLIGALISLPLAPVLQIVAQLKHTQIEVLFPPWLYGASYVLEFVFPLAVAYVIVVHRAMDVRLIIRQSLQYTLARRGVIILQAVLSAILFIAVAALVTEHRMSYAGTVILMAAGLWGIFLLNGITHRLAAVIDRRFFREAYDAEQILNDLAERVRSIVEIEPLLKTVAGRIAEALHVSKVSVLLNEGGPFQVAYSRGHERVPLNFPDGAGAVQQLKEEKKPVRVYFEDRNGWLYNEAVSEEERRRLREMEAELLLPLFAKDTLTGFMALGRKRSEAPYSGSDLRLLNSVAAQTGLAIEVSRLTMKVSVEAAQRERLNRELEIAREVQQKLFPQLLPSVHGLDYCAECRPAREVGGDYYDFLELPDGKFTIAVGDVSGKGIGAALMMASLQASLRGQAPIIRHMPALMQKINKMVYESSSANRYATFFYGEYDAAVRRLTYVNAGHNPPVVLRGCGTNRQIFRWETGGPVIGLLPEVEFQAASFDFEPSDMVVLFTDGISESMNANDEEWGEERLLACAKTCEGLNARETLDRMMQEAVAFAAGAPQHDDMTLAVFRVER